MGHDGGAEEALRPFVIHNNYEILMNQNNGIGFMAYRDECRPYPILISAALPLCTR
jgi:hypothetical protein